MTALSERQRSVTRIGPSSPGDLAAYVDLLERAGLPPEGLAECLATALVARAPGGEFRGAVALELYGADALLRSLVVDAAARGSGLGTALVDAVLDLARRRGVTRLYLLTESAAPFFARRGFVAVGRGDVPAAVLASVQFRSVCPQSAGVRSLALPAAPATRPSPSQPLPAVQPDFVDASTDRRLMSQTTIAVDNSAPAAKTCCGPDCCGGTEATTTAIQTPTSVAPADTEALVAEVRARYGAIAATSGSCCGPTPCGAATGEAQAALARGIGYTDAELALLPEGANLGLGCGAPLAALAPQPGETVLDLGSGAGMDAFIAAERVGRTGRVLGVDMTPEMLERARTSATRLGLAHVEFRAGRLEELPVESASVDAVTSNCVINLVPDKQKVFAEIARVLRPGGRLVISDIVLDRPLPARLANDLFAYAGCVAGAALRTDYLAALTAAGLGNVEILRDVDYLASVYAAIPAEIDALLASAGVTAAELAGSVRSITFRARAGGGATA